MDPRELHSIVEYIGLSFFVLMVLYAIANFLLPLLVTYFLHFYTWVVSLVVRFHSHVSHLEALRASRRSPSEPSA